MGNLVLATPHIFDAATIDNATEDAAAPATNLQLMSARKFWQAPDPAAANMEIDLGAAKTINLVAGLFANATSAATWRIRAAASKAELTGGPTILDTGAVTFWASAGLETWDRTHGLYWNAAGVSARWWRLDFDDGANPDGVFRMGRLYIDAAFQGAHNFNYGANFGFDDKTKVNETLDGAIDTVPGRKIPALDLTLDFLSEAELFANHYEIARRQGHGKDVLVILDPDEATYLMQMIYYGRLTAGRPLSLPGFNRYRMRLSMKGID